MISIPLLFAADKCVEYKFLGLPTWYHYLNDGTKMAMENGHCVVKDFNFPIDLALVGLGLLDIALRLAGLVAIGFVIYGGFQFVTSQGDPEASKHARQTIINALIGLVIALFATALVAFVGTRLFL